MAVNNSSQHFRSWVPQWLVCVVALLVLIPVMLINGAYTGSSVDISGALGVLSEDINMAYYAASAGMAIAYPIIPLIKPVATSKTIIQVVLFCQFILSWICAITTSMEVITICSFFIGYFKAFTLLEIIAIIMPIFSPSNTRNEFYSKFYPITLTLGQLSLVLTAEFAYRYQWQHMYYFLIALLLFAMVLVVIFMAFGRKLIRIPYKEIDWYSFFQCSLLFMCILYVVTYGKTNDWFASNNIVVAAVLIPIVGWMFIRRQLITDGRPFVDLSVMKNRNSVVVYLFSFIMMFFASFTILTASYVNSVLRLDTTRSNELYLYMIPGIILGGFICYYFFKKAIRMAWLIFIGFSCFTLAIGLLYFNVEPMGLYEDLYIPMFLKGLGMLILFVALAVYAIQGLEPQQLIYNAFFLIGSRSVLAPAVGSSILSNWLYRLQQQNTVHLSESVDQLNPIANSLYSQTYTSSLLKGLSIEDAQRMAINALYSKVQIQALTISIKEILGYMLIMGIILLVVILLYFFKYKPVTLVAVGRDMH
ncbi:hypothetical protein CLV62_11150 [Dysgonomonas alginatilytica]|uniref:MFS transporter n=1 Tax=Dysgonomonas alginatilytica TaxID=1605892 RepID=A0A2V3PNC5_9BACT|nr:MFS transporter [Dysgonomonas alginatilytica]PXV64092.1 hypothetical protein CLV62_11150 [Dysgonomonas alginatilytica]